MAYDIRLLTLYKQHYLDKYPTTLNSNYSCWGYYDGMDISEVKAEYKSSLFQNDSLSPISRLWYCTGEKIREINGQYSSQNIGLFRCTSWAAEKDENKIDFWKENLATIFFGVAFLQLTEPIQYEGFVKEIEKEFNANGTGNSNCRIISYCTLDNADLVLLIHGNSLKEMELILQKIETRQEIRYQHSILGVSEEYLKECASKEKILRYWKGNNCAIDDKVARLEIRLVSSGEEKLVAIEKEILEETNKKFNIKNYDTAKYSYVSGHENLMISFEDTDVKSMLVFLLPDGFATHQNPTYRKRKNKTTGQYEPHLYNIETSYILNIANLSSISAETYSKDAKELEIEDSFRNYIEKYKENLKSQECQDEGLYAYYLALFQTLNSLVQYEQFALSKDIYYLLYPSFSVFDRKLQEALEKAKNGNPVEMNQLKKSMCEYIESVNSVIYHTIHTNQVFLMIPGYSGTSFSIPIKLNMLFLWFTDCIAQLWESDKRQYQCILVPTMESKPETRLLQFSNEETNFLVCVKVSQRVLSMPRALLVILAHEMGHYIGNVRCRKLRAEKLKIFVAQYLTNCVLPEPDKNVENSEKTILGILRDKCQKNAETIIDNDLNQLETTGYYGKDVEKVLKSACRRLLAETRIDNTQSIMEIKKGLEKEFEKGNEFKNYIVYIYHKIENAESNAMDQLIHGIMEKEITKELKIYREAFSDILAIRLLGCSKEAYEEAHRISEGTNILSEESVRRRGIVCALGNKFGWHTQKNKPETLTPADNLLYEYLEQCIYKVDSKIKEMNTTQNEILPKIRKLYNLFDNPHNDDGETADHDMYSEIVNYIQNMKDKIIIDSAPKR